LAKGIRVNQLAKELAVPSKAILDKLRDEGLGEKAPNHMSVLPLGLAESVREWFHSSNGGGTAVETAPPVAVETKPKTARKTTRKKADAAEAPGGAGDESGGVAVEEAPPTTEEEPASPVLAEHDKPIPKDRKPTSARKVEPAAPAAKIVSDESDAGGPLVVELPSAPTEPVAPMVPEAPPAIAAEAAKPAPAAPAAPGTPAAPAAPVARTPSAAAPPAAAAHGAPPDPLRPAPARPTITLANRGGIAPPVERKPVTPAPQLVKPEAAKIQGPRIVREEAPEVVPTPRARRPMGQTNETPSFTQARPQAGRGVRATVDDEEEDKKKAAAKKGAGSLSSRRRGPDGRRGEAMEKLREFTEADLIERKDRLNAARDYVSGFNTHLKQSTSRGQHVQAKTAVQRGEPVEVSEPITVKELSAALGVKSNDIQSRLLKQGMPVGINQALTRELAEMVALEYGIELRFRREQTLEEQLEQEFEERTATAKPEDVVPRPPVVTILGHVDHGKTSLLDKIRHANVAAGEAGGITQHTAAWMVELAKGDGKKRVTFIDTPGHQAFTSMRARGANMTDVVVLVVSAAEGVQPQTVESINHARAAGVPIVVALNKIDRPDANPEMVLGQLAKEGLNPVDWGGDTEVVRTSATTGEGIETLIETLDYQAELLELKADPNAPARGAVIESRVDPGLGNVATALVQDGTLHVGDVVLTGTSYGRVRSLLNDRGEMVQEAGPAMPVIISGLDALPNAGDKFFVLDDVEGARAIAEERQALARQQQLAQKTAVTLDSVFAQMKAGEIKTINLIIKGDVQGSVETLQKTVTDQNTSEVRVRVIHAAVGGITESDVELADASNAVIIGFNVVPDETARAMAEQRHVEIRTYRVIYEIFDDLKKALSGMLEPEIREKLHGHAEVRQTFKVSRVGVIAGCFVTDGHIQRGSKIRLTREGRIITEDLSIESLKRLKDDVREVKAGLECGIKLAGYDDIKVGDILEAYVRETFQRTL